MNSILRHALCILLLAVLCLLVRLPSLDRIALNPDESQYEATASYLLATGASPYAFPYGTVTTFALYKSMAALFGPYCMLEIRVLVMLIVMAMAAMLYLLVARATSWWCGLLGAVVFLHYNLFFEGLSANREWFSGFLILAGMLLFSLEKGRRPWLLAVAGLVAGCSLWFKLQAVYLLVPIPLVLAWQAAAAARYRAMVGRIAAYCAGVAAAVALHLLPFLIAGTLPRYIESLSTRLNSYVLGNEAATAELPAGSFAMLFWELPQRSLLIAAYCAALLLLAAVIRKRAGSTALLFVLYLVAALMTVKMGGLYFGHYYLFLVPPVAGLLGMAANFFATVDRGAMIGRIAGLALIVLLIADRIADIESGAVAIAYVVIAVSLLGVVAWRPSRLVPAVVVALLWLETAAVVAQSQPLKRPDSLPFHHRGYSQLVQKIDDERREGDRLFVWGWAPEIYSLTRLEAASHFSICQYVVNDYSVAAVEPALDPFFADMVMEDLESRRPRFIVDAWRRSWTMDASNDPRLYDLRLYPQFGLRELLESNYRSAGSFDGCDLYIRD